MLTNTDVDAALADAREHYAAAHPASRRVHEAALGSLPGGNTAPASSSTPFPSPGRAARAAHLWDEDGHRVTDFLGEATAGIYGHSHPAIRAAVEAQLDRGWNFGGHTPWRAAWRRCSPRAFPAWSACGSAIQARKPTPRGADRPGRHRRPAVMGFAGCYHGGFLTFTAKTNPLNVPIETVVAPFNDADAAAATIDAHADRLAAVIVEPMIGGGGCIPGRPGLPADAAGTHRPPRHRADLRRGDDLPPGARRHAGTAGHHPGPHHAWQVYRRRLHGRGVRRPGRPDGGLRPPAGGAAATFRHLQQQRLHLAAASLGWARSTPPKPHGR